MNNAKLNIYIDGETIYIKLVLLNTLVSILIPSLIEKNHILTDFVEQFCVRHRLIDPTACLI